MQPTKSKVDAPSNPWLRETIDSFGVALILAFLFRAFVAEAFVIPTGSMAPTLMGAHKDVVCSQCGQSYQTAASNEFNNDTGELGRYLVVGTTCPICRFQQPIDPVLRPNDSTFSGDRILVSKLAYIQSNPERWQVFVFKNPGAARQNFIKRLVGLPNETLRVEHGDIYVKAKGDATEFEIARKPPHIVEVHLQPLNDTSHRSSKSVEAGLPSPWQPEGPIPPERSSGTEHSTGWTVTNTADLWKADFSGSAVTDPNKDSVAGFDWLRYHHYALKPWQWYQVETGKKLSPAIVPRSSQLISDFTHYNANLSVSIDDPSERSRAYSLKRKPFGLVSASSLSISKSPATDGMNWVGDLACEFDIQLGSDSGTIAFDLVEAGVHYVLQVDVSTGKAKVQAIENGTPLKVFGARGQALSDEISANTAIRGKNRFTIKYANVDSALHIWVNGSYVEFQTTNFYEPSLPPNKSQHRPQYSLQDSADAAPVGVAASNGLPVNILNAKVWRDIYYTAVDKGSELASDYDFGALATFVDDREVDAFRDMLTGDFSSEEVREYLRENRFGLRRDIFFESPKLWANSDFFSYRRSVDFPLGPDEFFPMGDNSIESSDGRLWSQKFVERDLLIGRAALVFWPHPWKRPIPYMPDFRRMEIIR